MKVYHDMKVGSYNMACAFLHDKVTITAVTNYRTEYYFWSGGDIVAEYSEWTGVLKVYRDLNLNHRCYGKLH